MKATVALASTRPFSPFSPLSCSFSLQHLPPASISLTLRHLAERSQKPATNFVPYAMNFSPNSSSISYQGFQEQMMQNLSQMSDVIDPLAAAAKSEPEKIGHRVRTSFVVVFWL